MGLKICKGTVSTNGSGGGNVTAWNMSGPLEPAMSLVTTPQEVALSYRTSKKYLKVELYFKKVAANP